MLMSAKTKQGAFTNNRLHTGSNQYWFSNTTVAISPSDATQVQTRVFNFGMT